ncbi:MAG TPA: hypothetical protein PK771_07355 [Spirochaetota bacterium]|nr:hypothetical protein [Spirochaetota bacterium]
MNLKKIVSYLIINIPVFLFILVGVLFLAVSLISKNLWFLIGIWWSISGAVMLSIDFVKRKKNEFYRLLEIFKNDKQVDRLKNNLKQTICGFSLLMALKYRLKSGI